MYVNRVVRISLAGGLIGLIATNPRRALENAIDKGNQDGFHCHQIVPHSERNIFVFLLQIVVLILTIGMWTWGGGYILLFQKEKSS